MNKKKKNQIVMIVIIVVIAVIVGIVVSKQLKTKEARNQETIQKTLIEDKKYKGITFTDIKVTSSEESNHIVLNMVNNSKDTFNQEFVNIIFKKKDGTEIATIKAMIPDIEVGKSSKLDMVVSKEVLKSYTFTIEQQAE